MSNWLLPENISDVLPQEARRVEQLRRALLDLYRSFGYEYVIPPLIEHLESLLSGTDRDLDLRTFKLVDQSSGRSLGVRADATPQTARIDAHILNRNGVVRLCYAGPVLHARPMHPLASREPIQVGAELYGDAAIEADGEVLQLAARSLELTGATDARIELGHSGVLRALLAAGRGAPAAACVAGGPGAGRGGGRSDDLGRLSGRGRPATGFSIVDLREATQLAGPAAAPKAILAPHAADPELEALVAALRVQGQIVVRSAERQVAEADFEFDREIRRVGARWQVVAREARSSSNGSAEAQADGR